MVFIIKTKPSAPPLLQKLSIALHASVFCIVISMCILMFKNNLFSWHPVFMTIGYIIFMTEGVLGALLFRHMDGLERVKAIEAHAYMQLKALLFIVLGAGVIVYNKIRLGKMHFQSNHAKIGLASLIFAVLVPLGGAISFRKLGYIHLFPEKLHPLIKSVHRKSGFIAWLLALVAIEIILPHKAVYRPYVTRIWQVAVAAVAALVLFIAVRFSQAKSSIPSTVPILSRGDSHQDGAPDSSVHSTQMVTTPRQSDLASSTFSANASAEIVNAAVDDKAAESAPLLGGAAGAPKGASKGALKYALE